MGSTGAIGTPAPVYVAPKDAAPPLGGPQQVPEAPAPPVPEAPPRPEDAVVVNFSLKTDSNFTVNTHGSVTAAVTLDTQAKVDTSVVDNADVQPRSIARVGDNFIVNFGLGKSEKMSMKFLEAAMASGKLDPGSKLGKALMMTELVTNSALPSRAQRAIHAMASSGKPADFANAQQSAVFASFVEGFASKDNLAAARAFIDKIPDKAQREALSAVFETFNAAVTKATSPTIAGPNDTQIPNPDYGNYQEAYDALMPVLTLAAPHGEIYPEPAESPIVSSSLIAIVNSKSKTAISKAAHGTRGAEDDAAIKNPGKVLAKYNKSWNAIRHEYHHGKLTHPGAGMEAMLKFRETTCNRIFEKVKKATIFHAKEERATFNKELTKRMKAEGKSDEDIKPFLLTLKVQGDDGFALGKDGKPDKDKPLPADGIVPISWGSAGSQDATSDIDVNLKGDETEFASQTFNKMFTDEFGLDSGVVFDVNVYASDFLPMMTSKLLVSNADKTDKTVLAEAKASKAIVWDAELTDPAAIKTFSENQDFASRYMIRTYMSDVPPSIDGKSDWAKHKDHQLGLCKTPEAREDLEKTFIKVEKEFEAHNNAIAGHAQTAMNLHANPKLRGLTLVIDPKQITATTVALEKLLAGPPAVIADPDERTTIIAGLVMRAENHIYGERLDTVATARMEVRLATTELAALETAHPVDAGKVTAQKAKVETAFLTLRVAMTTALMFANEPYLTEASVLHVVANKQVLTKGVGDAAKIKPSKVNIPLTSAQWMQSINEQFGCSLKELGRHPGAGVGEAVVHGGKYLFRLLNGAKHLETVTGTKIPGPPSQDFLRAMFKSLVETKKNTRIPDDQKDAICVKLMQEWCIRNPSQGIKPEQVATSEGLAAILTDFHNKLSTTHANWQATAAPDAADNPVRDKKAKKLLKVSIIEPVIAYRLPTRTLPSLPSPDVRVPVDESASSPAPSSVVITLPHKATIVPPSVPELAVAVENVTKAVTKLKALGGRTYVLNPSSAKIHVLNPMPPKPVLSAPAPSQPVMTKLEVQTSIGKLKTVMAKAQITLDSNERKITTLKVSVSRGERELAALKKGLQDDLAANPTASVSVRQAITNRHEGAIIRKEARLDLEREELTTLTTETAPLKELQKARQAQLTQHTTTLAKLG